MLTATPRSCFSWDYTVSAGDEHLADVDISWWREKGQLVLAGKSYTVYRERPLSGKFILECGGVIVASAEKPSSLTRRMIVEHAGARHELKPANMFSRKFHLHSGPAIVGTLSARGIFSRRMSVDLPETLPLPVRVFVTWLTIMLWRREANSG